jgi:hypothetical protein
MRGPRRFRRRCAAVGGLGCARPMVSERRARRRARYACRNKAGSIW